jgi:hypothetical protein
VPIVVIGIAVQISVEWLAVDRLGLWGYQAGQPTLPLIGTGLLPILYAVIIVPLSFWLVAWWFRHDRRRQERHRSGFAVAPATAYLEKG